MHPSISLSDLWFSWPDGSPVVAGIDTVFGGGRTGLVGANGSGKSTLLRLIAGEIAPNRGSVSVSGRLSYLPQSLPMRRELCVEELLGIESVRSALRAIESGSLDVAHFDAVGRDWDIEERAVALIDRVGLHGVALDRTVEGLSGGECTLLGLVGCLLEQPAVLLLDEPTNNLDRFARRRLLDVVGEWKGALLVVSHDREMLDSVDAIAELRDGTIRNYGGDLAFYEAAVANEQAASHRAAKTAESHLRRQERELSDARTKLDRRVRYGKKMYETKREPKIVMGARKRTAQVSAGKLRDQHEERIERARTELAEARRALVDDREIRLDMPDAAVPARQRVATVLNARLPYGPVLSLEIRGPERIGLVGRNGVGKSTLLRSLVGAVAPFSGTVDTHVPARYLPQSSDLLDDSLSVVDNVVALAPNVTVNETRARLAKLLFRGASADQLAGTLSGGERLRANLATVLLSDPPPRLLLFDEPTNNLDLASVGHLTSALLGYEGALVVVSHQEAFLRGLRLTRWLELDAEGLHDIDPL